MKMQPLLTPLTPSDMTEADARWLIPHRPDRWYPGAEVAVDRIANGTLFPIRLGGPGEGLLLLEKDGDTLNVFWVAGRGILRHLPMYMQTLKAMLPAGVRLKGYVPSGVLAGRYIEGGATIARYEMEF